MNEKIKNYLGIAAIFFLAVFAYAIFIYADSYSKSIEPSSFRSFSVSGDGKVIGKPDVSKFSFSVITEGGKNIGALQKENSEKNNKAVEFLKLSGVKAEDIKTINYNLEPRYQYYSCPINKSGSELCPPPEIVGYKIIQSVSVKIRDFSKIGDIMAGTVKNGANEISHLSFEIDDLTALQNQAREEAIKKAKEKAEFIAKAGNFGLGRLLSIEEGGASPQPIYYRSMKAASLEEISQVPIIEPGSQEISVNMFLKYEIE
ncbi:SIMPL domain-containing protein [Candidatus Wolfebacteria bacterium]|nr:SIMPL domain-containing protein [Candidatus Wolfebacteria bacterium]